MIMAKILLIDDDEINNFTVNAVLKRVGSIQNYAIKDNGWDALEYLKANDNKDTFPDFIFVDINMPEMDGFEFLERYEVMFWPQHPNTRISMLSSSVSERDRERALQFSSVCEYVCKPLTESKLVELLH